MNSNSLQNRVVYLEDKNEIRSIKENMDEVILRLGGIADIVKPNFKVLIKPNFVAPFEKATTNLEMVRYMIEEVIRLGGIPIIGESSGFEFRTDTTFEILGLKDLANQYQVELVNFDNEDFVEITTEDGAVKKFLISKTVLECDAIINMPKLKGHSLTKVTFGMKNLFGTIHRDTRRRIHSTNLEYGIYTLNKIIKPQLTIVDGLWTLNKAVFSESSYNGVIIAGRNVNMVDFICCNVYGIDYKEVEHIRLAVNQDLIQKIDLVSCFGNCMETSIQKVSSKNRLKYLLHNFVYKSVYITDFINTKLFKKQSLIPDFHLTFGVRPVINKKACSRCGKCLEVCHVNCISDDYEIDYNLCKYVRCMKCKEVCPNSAVDLRGFHIK